MAPGSQPSGRCPWVKLADAVVVMHPTYRIRQSPVNYSVLASIAGCPRCCPILRVQLGERRLLSGEGLPVHVDAGRCDDAVDTTVVRLVGTVAGLTLRNTRREARR